MTAVPSGFAVMVFSEMKYRGRSTSTTEATAKKIREHTLPRGHPHILYSLNHLATALEHAGKLDEAIATYKRAVAEVETTLGNKRPRVSSHVRRWRPKKASKPGSKDIKDMEAG